MVLFSRAKYLLMGVLQSYKEVGQMGKEEPPEEQDEKLEQEWNWAKERGEYIDGQIPPAPEDEFEKIWKRIQEGKEKEK